MQLLLRAKLDVVHSRTLYRVLDTLPLEAKHEQRIGLSALSAMFLVTGAMLDIVSEGAVVPAL